MRCHALHWRLRRKRLPSWEILFYKGRDHEIGTHVEVQGRVNARKLVHAWVTISATLHNHEHLVDYNCKAVHTKKENIYAIKLVFFHGKCLYIQVSQDTCDFNATTLIIFANTIFDNGVVKRTDLKIVTATDTLNPLLRGLKNRKAFSCILSLLTDKIGYYTANIATKGILSSNTL